MQLREPTDQLTGVAETLMITLYARAIETQRPEPILSVHGVCAKHNCKASRSQKAWIHEKGWYRSLVV